MVFVPAVVVVAFYFEKKRAFATGIAVAGSGIGTFIFAPFTEFLLERYHWRGAFMITSGIMLNTVLCGAIFRPLTSESDGMYRSKSKRSHKPCHHRQQESKMADKTVNPSNVQLESEADVKVVIELQNESKTQSSYAMRMKHRIKQNLSNLRLFRISETSNASAGDQSEISSYESSSDSDDGDSDISSSSTENTVERLSKSEPNLISIRSKHQKKMSTAKITANDKNRTSFHNHHHNCLNFNEFSPLQSQQPLENINGRFIVTRLARSTACINSVDSCRHMASPCSSLATKNETYESNHLYILRHHHDSVVPIHSLTRSEVALSTQNAGHLERNPKRHLASHLHRHKHNARYHHLVDSISSSQGNSSGVEATLRLLHSEKDLHEQSPANEGVKRNFKRPPCHFIDCGCRECSVCRHLTESQEKVKTAIPMDNLNNFYDQTATSAVTPPSLNVHPLITDNSGSGSSILVPKYFENRSSSISDHGDNIRSVNSLARGYSSGNNSGSDKFFFISGRQDMVYRGSLLRTGFFISHGRSASCPEVCMTPSKRNRRIREEKNNLLSLLGCCCDDDSDVDDSCCMENTPSHVCVKKCHPKQVGTRSFSLGKFVKAVANKFNTMVDLSVFKSPVFAFFNLHTVFLYLSYDIPYIYGPVRAMEHDISDSHASVLVAIIGIFSMIGQVAMGYLGDLPFINVTSFYNSMTAIAGCVILFVPLVTTFPLMSILYAGYGFFISANFALTTVILVELLGMNRLTNAFGIVSLAQGLANLVGPPLAGWLSDQTMSYDLAFYGSGAIILISGLMLFFTPCLEKCDTHGMKGNALGNIEVNRGVEVDKTRSDDSSVAFVKTRDSSGDELVLKIECDESNGESSRYASPKTKKFAKLKDKSTVGFRNLVENKDLKTETKRTPAIVITEIMSVAEEEYEERHDTDRYFNIEHSSRENNGSRSCEIPHEGSVFMESKS